MNFSAFQVITFDCYGTLIDWETGILNAVRPAFPGLERANEEILSIYSEVEPVLQQGMYQPYRSILREVLNEMGRSFHRKPANPEALPDSLMHWLPFPETIPALRRLKERYKLAIISNVDDSLFAPTARHLQVPFDCVVTAQQVGSYKPSLRNFHVALQRLGVDQTRILHVAESLFHDIAPAQKLGIANVWVNRRGDRAVAASRAAAAKPDLEVTSLTTLADLALG